MAWTPNTNLKYKKELLKDKRFYRLISQQTNFIDPDMAFLFYTSMVSVIGDELRKNKIVRLPHLGDMALVVQKPRVAWVGKVHALIGRREVLRFYFKKHLKLYFGKMQGPPEYLELLPPRAIR